MSLFWFFSTYRLSSRIYLYTLLLFLSSLVLACGRPNTGSNTNGATENSQEEIRAARVDAENVLHTIFNNPKIYTLILREALQDSTESDYYSKYSLGSAIKHPNANIRYLTVRIIRDFAIIGVGHHSRNSYRLKEALKDPEKFVRSGALIALEEIGAVRELAVALEHPDKDVRRSTVVSLNNIGAVRELAVALKHSDKDVRLDTAKALKNLGKAASPAVNELAAALKDPDKDVRWYAVRTLENLGKAASPAVNELAAALKDPDKNVRQSAVGTLENLGKAASPAVNELAAALKNPDKGVRQSAAQTLENLGKAASPAVNELAAALKKDPNPYVSLYAARTLGNLGTEALPALNEVVEALTKNKDVDVEQVLLNLGKKASPALPKLKAALKDKDQYLSSRAARAIGIIGVVDAEILPFLPEMMRIFKLRAQARVAGKNDSTIHALRNIIQVYPSVLENLNKQLKDPDMTISSFAALLLVYINTDNFIASTAYPDILPKLFTTLKDSKGGDIIAASALGEIGQKDSSVVPKLLTLLKDPNKDVRQSTAWALGKIGKADSSVVPKLGGLLKDPNKYVRWSAAKALGDLGKAASPAVRELAVALEHPDKDVRTSAIQVLENLGKAALSAVPELAKALTDKDYLVRKSAAQVLENLDLENLDKEASPAVIELAIALKDKRHYVRRSATQALENIGTTASPAIPKLVTILKDPNRDKNARSGAGHALGKIAVSFQKKANQLSPSELDRAISNFEEAFKILREQFLKDPLSNDFNGFDLRKQINGIRVPLSALKGEKQSRIGKVGSGGDKHPKTL